MKKSKWQNTVELFASSLSWSLKLYSFLFYFEIIYFEVLSDNLKQNKSTPINKKQLHLSFNSFIDNFEIDKWLLYFDSANFFDLKPNPCSPSIVKSANNVWLFLFEIWF